MSPTEVQIGEHWDQLCIRHMECILSEVSLSRKWINIPWNQIPEDVKVSIRPLVVDRWKEWQDTKEQ